MSKHTPSPWSVKSADWDSEGDVRYTLNGIKHFSAPHKNLIEAAPDFYNACKALIDYCDKNPPMGDSLWCVQQIRAALKKADGEAP